MQQIPLQPVPSQLARVVLAGQNTQLLIYEKPQGVFVDVNVDGTDIVAGIIALDAVPIVCREYAGFVGNILFIDTQGSADPTFEGFGGRFALVYLTDEEYALIRQ